MTTGFLIDVHIPLALMTAVRRMAPDAEVRHAARWQDGALRTAQDERILAAAADANLILVTQDVRTIQPLADRWVAEGRSFPGVVFIPGGGASSTDIGAVARALVALHAHLELLDPAYPIVYLRPASL